MLTFGFLTRRCVWICTLFVFLLFAAEFSVQAQSLPVSPANSESTTEQGPLVRMPGNTHWLARNEFDQGRVADSLPQNHILMMLKRTPEQEQALDQLMKNQYDPQSPDFHRWLTPEQFAARFGPSAADANRIALWLQQRGFKVNRIAAGRTFIDFNGTAGQIAAAFHTEIHRYRVSGRDHFANASDPYIPAEFSSLVAGFRALNDFHPKPLVQSPGIARLDRNTGTWSKRSSAHLDGGQGINAGFLVGPSDFAKIYGVDQAWRKTIRTSTGRERLVGTGQTIGVVGDTDLSSSDIQSFRDQFGITALGPNGSVQVDVPPSSVCSPPDASNNDPEGYIDAEWSGAMAPDATIDFVACNDSGVTSGADLAAAYIVQDAAHAERDAVLSSSFGYCEQDPISESAAFYVSLWQQAAAEGITVVVAAGDSGPAECDEFGNYPYATSGFGVNAEASTPYNIAAGGTDFSDVFSGTTSRYWAPTNNSNLGSAKSYIPETTWNDSCASPLVLQAFGQGFASSAGPDGFCTYASEQPIQPETGLQPYFLFYAGSGGLSTVSARPSWQSGVAGIPSGSARALPDISMFASSGFAWGHTLLFCDSGDLPPGYTCDLSNPNNLYYNEDGGTSFVAPSFSGIMALIVQKYGRQGQANHILYPLAGEQYIDSTSPAQPNLATCAAYLGTNALPSCYFHDVSATPNPDPATRRQKPFLTGTISVPCIGSASSTGVYTDTSTGPASNSEDCFDYEITVSSQGGSLATTPDYYGIVSTADNAQSPAYPATPGYDLATGLGSPNVAALIDAPQWSTGSLLTSVTLEPSASTITSDQSVQLVAMVTVQSQGAVEVRGGKVTFYSAGRPLGIVPLDCRAGKAATLRVPGAAFGPVGDYTDVYAVYSGGAQECGRESAIYFGSHSSPVTVDVEKANTGHLRF